MFGLTRRQPRPIGVDVGADAVKLLQLGADCGSVQVHAAARLQLPQGARLNACDRLDALAEQLRPVLSSGQFKGRQIAAALPRELVQIKPLRMDPVPEAESEAAIRAEAQSIFPLDLNDCSLRFIRAGRVRQGSRMLDEVIVAAARNADVARFLRAFDATGADVLSLQIAPLAAYRAVASLGEGTDSASAIRMLVDVGSQSSQVIIGKGSSIRFIKSIGIGSSHVHEALSRRLSVTGDEARQLRRRMALSARGERLDSVAKAVNDATRELLEELAREVGLCAQYYCVTFRGARPQRASLLGGESDDPLLQRLLTAALGIPAEPEHVASLLDCPQVVAPERSDILGGWGVAYGLALWQSPRPEAAPVVPTAAEFPLAIELNSMGVAGA